VAFLLPFRSPLFCFPRKVHLEVNNRISPASGYIEGNMVQVKFHVRIHLSLMLLFFLVEMNLKFHYSPGETPFIKLEAFCSIN